MRHLRQILLLLPIVTLTAAACAPEPFPSLGSLPGETASQAGIVGPYGTGTLHYAVSGALTVTDDLDLAIIDLEPGSASLLYGDQTGASQYVHLDVSAGLSGLDAAGGPLDTSGSTQDTCAFTIDHLDAKGVSGSFECRGLTLLDPTKGDIGKVSVIGTFNAKV
ncbi:MAG: hypothetical protein E6J47_04960 [Chloroflexi bacterium]|nr:MAG: hypothetical protein E6J47_04960 [Chloroflexota bacterium]